MTVTCYGIIHNAGAYELVYGPLSGGPMEPTGERFWTMDTALTAMNRKNAALWADRYEGGEAEVFRCLETGEDLRRVAS